MDFCCTPERKGMREKAVDNFNWMLYSGCWLRLKSLDTGGAGQGRIECHFISRIRGGFEVHTVWSNYILHASRYHLHHNLEKGQIRTTIQFSASLIQENQTSIHYMTNYYFGPIFLIQISKTNVQKKNITFCWIFFSPISLYSLYHTVNFIAES